MVGLLRIVFCFWMCFYSTVAFQSSTCTDSQQLSILESVIHCRLRDTTLHLDDEMTNVTNAIQIIPDVVVVKRCKGSCHLQSHQCVPTSTKRKSINVMIVVSQFPLGHAKTRCETIEIEEHSECSCGCPIGPATCSHDQYFEPGSCRCICSDHRARNLCAGRGMLWDMKRCMCMCPISTWTACSTGYSFDFLDTCICLPINNNASTSILVTSIIFISFFIASAIGGYYIHHRNMKRNRIKAERRKEAVGFFMESNESEHN
ncbi:uncharacterized protein [Lepeophtheirus salmonis]|nr:uncharacterized protein LOC121120368 [Lepeophtheirus salmonis]